MKWKIYFWICVLIGVLSAVSLFVPPYDYQPFFVVELLIFAVSLVGVWGYIYKKKLLYKTFWEYFFWLNIILNAGYILYALFPNAPLIQSLSFLSHPEEYQVPWAMFGAVMSSPALYAMCKLSKGQFREEKAAEKKEIGPQRWGMLQTALWGYSIIITSIFLIGSFLPATSGPNVRQDLPDIFYGLMMIVPLFLFWMGIVIKHKKYTFNWWKWTLVANALIYTGMMIGGILYFDPTVELSSGFDSISTLQFGIILVGLVVFGREQFTRS